MGGFHTQARACMDWYDGSRANTSIWDGSNLSHTNTHTRTLAQWPANTKRGRWAPFCVELKAAPQSQYPPATLPSTTAAGVHQPRTGAGSVSRSGSRNTWPAPSPPPGSERPRRYHLGAGSVHAGLRVTNWFGGVASDECGPRNILWRGAVRFEVRDKRAAFYVVNCTRVTPAMRIDPRPKDTQQGGGSLWSPQCQSVYLPESPEIWLD